MSAAVARLQARPGAVPGTAPLPPGTVLHVPDDAPSPTPLALMLHGAGGSAAGALQLVRDAADAVKVVLPIDRCGRRAVTVLHGAGYDVRYEEFDGGHVIPPSLARAAFAWLAR